MWRRSDLIHFSGLGLSRALLPFFFSSIRLILYLFSVFFFGEECYFDYFGSLGFPRADGSPSCVEAVFFLDFYIQVDGFWALRGAIG